MEDIGRLIHERRKELGITLEKIGNACGVNRSTVLRWENGTAKDIKRSHIEILSRLLYLPIEALLGLDDNIEIEDAELVLIKKDIVASVNSIKDKSKLDNLKKYIEVFC